MTRKSKNAMNGFFLKLNFLQNHGSMNLQDHGLNYSAVSCHRGMNANSVFSVEKSTQACS